MSYKIRSEFKKKNKMKNYRNIQKEEGNIFCNLANGKRIKVNVCKI